MYVGRNGQPVPSAGEGHGDNVAVACRRLGARAHLPLDDFGNFGPLRPRKMSEFLGGV